MILNLFAYITAFLSALYALTGIFLPRVRAPWPSAILQGTTGSALLVILIVRSMEIGFIALTGLFDSLLFFAMALFFLSLWLNIRKRKEYPATAEFGALLFALAMMLVASSPLISSEALAPIPALRSGWLILHVAFSFIGETFLVFSFVTALMVLFTKQEEKARRYDLFSYRSIIAGYVIFSLGALVFGAIWAEHAWGRFWGWDPKETWALITWLIYSIYLHFRLIKKSGRRVCAWISVLGFLSTLFTLFGVNFLISYGLHSYS